MQRPTIVLAAMYFACGTAIAAEGQSRPIDRLRFEGVTSFEAESIRQKLACDVDAVLAERPPIDYAGLIEAIERIVLLGYHHGGFRTAKVSASYDANGDVVTVAVDEGPRHRCGGVRVAGVTDFPVQRLIDSLAIGDSQQSALWQRGEPATFDDFSVTRMRDRIVEGLAKEGYLRPAFDLQVEAESHQADATLVLQVNDIGPRAQVGRIRVEGSNRDDASKVIRYLGLASDQPFDTRRADDIKSRLLESGRYLASEIKFERSALQPKPGHEAYDLTIQVREYDLAPPLDVALSAEQEAVLKVAEWAQQWSAGEQEEDVMITGAFPLDELAELIDSLLSSPASNELNSDMQCLARVIVSPKNGMLATFRVSTAEDSPIEEWVLTLHGKRLVLGSLGRHARLEIEHDGALQADVSLRIGESSSEASPNPDRPFSFVFGLTGKKVKSSTSKGLMADVSVLPASLLPLLQREHCRCTWAEGRLSIVGPEDTVLIDGASGRPIAMERKTPGGRGRFILRTEAGAFLAEQARIDEQLSSAFRYEGATPWRSVLCFLLDELISGSETQPEGDTDRVFEMNSHWRALRKLCHALQTTPENGEDARRKASFSLPERPSFDLWNDFWGGDMEARRHAVGYALGLYRQTAPREGWLWPLGRDLLLTRAVGALPEGYAALARSNDVGPWGEYVLAWFGAKDAARLGLERSSLERFRAEYRPLLTGDSTLSKQVLSLGTAARSLEARELRALTGFVENESIREALGDALTQLGQDPQQPIDQALGDVLDHLWTNWLGPNLRTTFLATVLRENPAASSVARRPSQPGSPPADSPLLQRLKHLEEIENGLATPPAKPDSTNQSDISSELNRLNELEKDLRGEATAPPESGGGREKDCEA